jgi:pachytene checkpoint protein 2
MQKLSAIQSENFNQPKGIQLVRRLPDPALGALWNSIILDERVKAQLLSQAMLNFTMRGKVDRSVIPLHGVILLVGPPGTGKTSLARGLAHRTAETFPGSGFRLLEVEPHALTSSAMGKTQRAVQSCSHSRSLKLPSQDQPLYSLMKWRHLPLTGRK